MFDVRTVAVEGNETLTSSASPDGITIFGMNVLTPLTTTFCVELYTKSGSFASAASNPAEWKFLGSFSLVGQGPTTPTPIPMGAFDPIVMGADGVQAFYVTTQDETLRYTALEDEGITGGVYSSSDVHYVSAVAATERTIDNADDERKKKGFGLRDRLDRKKTAIREEDDGDRRRIQDGNKYGPYGQETDERRLQAAIVGDGLKVEILTGVGKNYPFAESWPHRVFNGAFMYGVTTNPSLSFLSAEQSADAWAAKRGMVTCDQDAIDPDSYPSAAPSDAKLPTVSPTKVPTVTPTTLPSASPTETPSSLESTILKAATTLHGGLKQDGCMFDIKVPSVEDGGPSEGLSVIALEMSTFVQGEEICVEVYTKSGTYEGFENDVQLSADGSWSSSTWSILGAATVIGKGERMPTHIPIGYLDPVYVTPGNTQGFYVTMTKPEMRYTEPKYDEESGDLFSAPTNGHIQIMVGSAVSYPFEETWPDRIFNGAVVYALGEVEDGKYNDMTAADRNRTCPVPTEVPTSSPSGKPSESKSEVPTEMPSGRPSTVPTESPIVGTVAPVTSAPVTGAPVGTVTDTVDNVDAVDSEDTVDNTDEVDGTEDEVVTGDVVDNVDTPNPTPVPTPLPTPVPTSQPTTLMPVETPAEDLDEPQTDGTARLAETCPSAPEVGDETDVVVSYEYMVVLDGTQGANEVAAEMENVLHRDLMSNMCSGRRSLQGNAAERLLQTVTYQGFNSDPSDVVVRTVCPESIVTDGECYLIQGGVTAVVESNVDENVVKSDVGSYVEGVLSDSASYDGMGVESLAVVSSDSGGTPSDGTSDGTDGTTDGQDLNLDGSTGADQGPVPDDGDSNDNPGEALSTTGIILVSALAGTLFLVLLTLVVVRVRSKRGGMKRADSKELFQEFPDEEARGGTSSYGGPSTAGYNESFAPLGMSNSVQPPPPTSSPPRVSKFGASNELSGVLFNRASSNRSNRSNRSGGSGGSASAGPAMILNEQDDISLFSNDRSKMAHQFALPPDSPAGGSRGSRGSQRSQRSHGSNGSNKSVEFVRAGQSFSSRQSNQPEDTVDL